MKNPEAVIQKILWKKRVHKHFAYEKFAGKHMLCSLFFNPIPTGGGHIVSPPCRFFILKFPKMHILSPNWITFPKNSYFARKKQFFEIWPFHSPVVTSLSRLVGSCKLMIMYYIFLRDQMMFMKSELKCQPPGPTRWIYEQY